jgi:hypothetical protein
MTTLHHGFWTYFVFRKKRHLVKWFVLGSIAPDLVHFFMFLYLGIQKRILSPSLFLDLIKMPMFGISSEMSNMALTELHDFILEMFQHPWVIVLRFAGHSLFYLGDNFRNCLLDKGFKVISFNGSFMGMVGSYHY